MLFPDTVVVISGAAQGIGAAIANGFVQAGARVAFADLNLHGAQEAAAKAASDPRRAQGFQLDVRSAQSCGELVRRVNEAFGPVQVLVNNAALARPARAGTPMDQALDELHEVNVKGVVNLTSACASDLRQARGSVVNVTSLAAIVVTASSLPYAASKSAVAQITRFLARDFGTSGVRVNAIAPGFCRTPMTARFPGLEQREAEICKRAMLQRVADPQDMVGPVLFLASPMAGYVTGVVLPVDGGYSVN
jgi:NAD(P)-dependent dehydrogenase (short-subunit alcohol dehydrogenase family)